MEPDDCEKMEWDSLEILTGAQSALRESKAFVVASITPEGKLELFHDVSSLNPLEAIGFEELVCGAVRKVFGEE